MNARRIAAIVIPALALAFLLAAIHVYLSVKSELTEAAIARRLAVAQLAATTQSERLERMADLAMSLATRVRFADLVAAGDWEAAVQILRGVPADFEFIDRLAIFDAAGTLRADTALERVRGSNFSDRDWYGGLSRSGGKPYVSAVYRSAAPPRLVVFAVAAPIVDRQARRTGILLLLVKIDAFFRWAEQIDFGPGAGVSIVDQRGNEAFRTGAPARDAVVSLASDPVVARLLAGSSGVEVSGGKRLSAFVPARHGWGVVVQQPAAEAFAARDNQLRRLLAGYLIIAAVCGTALYFVARRQRASERRLSERLRILHEVDRAVLAEQPAEAIAAAVIQPLRELLRVPRAIVNRFDLQAGEVEWVAAAGRRRTHVGGGVRYSLRLMGDIDAMRRGEPQRIDVTALPDGPEKEALLESGVRIYLAVPMIAGGELIGALSFGGESGDFPVEQVRIAQEVAAQLAVATIQARLLETVKRHASELEQRVEERTAELDDLYNHAPCGYHSVDADGLIVRINDTWLSWLGYTRSEVVNRMKHAELMTPESAARFWGEAFPRFRREGRLEGVEFEYRRKDGSSFTGSLNATSVYDADGRYLMSRSTVFDVSALKRVTQELAAANKELEAFSYSVSHDLRAPLRAIDGYARMLEEDYGGRLDEEGRRLLSVVRGSSRHMATLIDDLLEFSRLSRQDLAVRPVDMTDLVWEVARELTREAGGKSVDISMLPPVAGDRSLLRQVWANLIGNALKYSAMNAAPVVEIGGSENGTEAVYWVRDNGVGFDVRFAAKLFGVFQRLHRADEFPGTGVGLAIVQRVVTRHGGRVWAEGEPGKGACFFFALPK